jgi:hypothetical protein
MRGRQMILENLIPLMGIAAATFGILWLIVGAWRVIGDLLER